MSEAKDGDWLAIDPASLDRWYQANKQLADSIIAAIRVGQPQDQGWTDPNA